MPLCEILWKNLFGCGNTPGVSVVYRCLTSEYPRITLLDQWCILVRTNLLYRGINNRHCGKQHSRIRTFRYVLT